MPNPSLIQVQHVTRYYGDKIAVDDISFELKPGEVLGFLGPNGAGKSTTMQMLTGNIAPSTGEILISDCDIINDATNAKRTIGYLPEHPPVYPDSTVDEYLNYCARLHRVETSSIASAVTRAKSDCGLEDVGQRLIGNLSKGYQQRIGIAQAIIHDPAVIILDEPTVGLDPIQIRQIRDLIRDLGQRRSVILSTHILSEVQAICDRVQIIQQGRLIYSGTIEELNQAHGQRSFTVGLHRPPAISELETFTPAGDVVEIDKQRFRLYFPDESPAEALVQHAVAQDWGLFELIPEHSSLEEIFVQLTDQDDQPVATEDAA